jgi:hypothetical protein
MSPALLSKRLRTLERAGVVSHTTVAGVQPRASRWWVVVNGGEVDVCDADPGHEVTATVRGDLRALTEVWRGDLSWDRALAAGRLVVEGPADARRSVPRWVGQSTLAAVPRPEPALSG